MTAVWGSADHHLREMVPITDGRRRRARCRRTPDCPNRATHHGVADGVALTEGCEFHVRRWVREGPVNRGDRSAWKDGP